MTKIQGLKFAINTMTLIHNEKKKNNEAEGAKLALEAKEALQGILEEVQNMYPTVRCESCEGGEKCTTNTGRLCFYKNITCSKKVDRLFTQNG